MTLPVMCTCSLLISTASNLDFLPKRTKVQMQWLVAGVLFFAVVDAAVIPSSPEPPKSEGMSAETRHRLVKAHGILMVLAWLFLVPSAILFARMLRDAFKHHKPFGLAMWFHVHRTFNIVAVLLMTASFFCVFIATGWKWKGIFSTAKNPTQLHTTAGVIAFVLAVAQPFLAMLRCAPSDARRPLFNWTHRLIAVVAFLCAMIAFIVAATEFKKLWTDSVLQTILVLIPAALLLVLWPLTHFWLPKDDICEDKKETESFLGSSSKYRKHAKKGYSLRLSVCFWAAGMMLATSIALCLLIAAGYKSK